jgi:hypothetical protein
MSLVHVVCPLTRISTPQRISLTFILPLHSFCAQAKAQRQVWSLPLLPLPSNMDIGRSIVSTRRMAIAHSQIQLSLALPEWTEILDFNHNDLASRILLLHMKMIPGSYQDPVIRLCKRSPMRDQMPWFLDLLELISMTELASFQLTSE